MNIEISVRKGTREFLLDHRGKICAPVNFPDLFTCSFPILTPSHDPAPHQPSFRIRRLRDGFLSARNRSLLLLLPFQLDMIRQLPLSERPRSLLEETRVVYARDPLV